MGAEKDGASRDVSDLTVDDAWREVKQPAGVPRFEHLVRVEALQPVLPSSEVWWPATNSFVLIS